MSDTPPMPAVPGAPRPRIEVGTAISWAFDRFKANAAAFIGLAAVVTVIQLLQQVGTGPLRNILTDCTDAQTPGQVNACLAATSVYAIVTIGLALLFGFLAFLAQIGVQRAAIRNTQGVPPTFEAMLTTQYLGKYIGFILLYALLFFLGLILCVLPGLVVLFLFQLGPYYILDKGVGVMQAFRSSVNVVTKNIGPALLMTLVNALAAILGSVLFGVLTLVTLPFAALFTAHMYRQFNGEPIR
jgi:uncharacterized membrane protein